METVWTILAWLAMVLSFLFMVYTTEGRKSAEREAKMDIFPPTNKLKEGKDE